jgi:hypothetical protein
VEILTQEKVKFNSKSSSKELLKVLKSHVKEFRKEREPKENKKEKRKIDDKKDKKNEKEDKGDKEEKGDKKSNKKRKVDVKETNEEGDGVDYISQLNNNVLKMIFLGKKKKTKIKRMTMNINKYYVFNYFINIFFFLIKEFIFFILLSLQLHILCHHIFVKILKHYYSYSFVLLIKLLSYYT